MSAFKVGDRVRILRPSGYADFPDQGLVVGNTGTVASFMQNGLLSVRTDNAIEPTAPGRDGWAFFPFEVELIEPGSAA